MVHGEQWPISLGKEAVEKASVVVVIALGRRGSSRYSVLGLKESQDYVLLTAAAGAAAWCKGGATVATNAAKIALWALSSNFIGNSFLIAKCQFK